jgi:hypothetical protein
MAPQLPELPIVVFVPAEGFNSVEVAIQELGETVAIDAGDGYATNNPSIIAQLDAYEYAVRGEPPKPEKKGGDGS